MEGLDAGDFLEGRAVRRDKVDETDAFEALEHPAHGRPIRRLLDLVGDRLPRRGELLAQAVLGQPVDQQAQHQD